jgi:hypothetical protein
MNRTQTKLKRVSLALCLTVFSGVFASAQTVAASSEARQPEANAASVSQSAEPSEAEANRFYDLTKQAPNALASGETDAARSYAETLLKEAERFPKNWNYGNAGKTPGSAQLNTFGPNMLLAKSLLEKKENEAVLQYFELCAKFWKMENGKLSQWKTAVQNNEMPDFAANLIYQMEALHQKQKSAQS